MINIASRVQLQPVSVIIATTHYSFTKTTYANMIININDASVQSSRDIIGSSSTKKRFRTGMPREISADICISLVMLLITV